MNLKEKMKNINEVQGFNLFDGKDVKEAVLKFEKILKKSLWNSETIQKQRDCDIAEDMEFHNHTILNLLTKHKYCFGDFEK